MSPLVATSTAQKSNRASDLPFYLVLLAATLGAYLQVADFSFIDYDDPTFVAKNLHLQHGLTISAMLWALKSTYAANWLPLTWVSYMLDYQLHGLDAGWYHLTNVFLHTLSVLLLYRVLNQMTGTRWCSAFVAFIFALHPVHIEPVVWISERKEVLCGVFWVLTISAYVHYVNHPSTGRYLAVAGLLCGGLLSKAMIVTLPFALLLLDVWPLNRLNRTSARGLCLEKVPLLALSGIASLITFFAQKGGGSVSSIELVPLHLRISNSLISYVVYVIKFVWPTNLAVIYPFRADFRWWQVLGAGLILALVTAFTLFEIKRRPYLAVGWLWFLGILFPVVGLVQIGTQSRADRYCYIPFIGLSIVVAWGAAEISARWKWRKPITAIALTAVCSAAFLTTRNQIGHWRDSITLFEHALDVTPANWVAHNGVAHTLLAEGRVEEAVPHLEASLSIEPNAPESHVMLGDALGRLDRMDAAEAQFRDAVRLQPDNPDAVEGLGMILTEKGEMNEALVHLLQAIRMRPDDPDSHYNLGRSYALSGRPAKAITEFSETVRLIPDDAVAHYNLGTALAVEGRLAEAGQQFREATRINPGYLKARLGLANILVNLGHCDEAVKDLKEVTRQEPDSEEARVLLERCGPHLQGR